MGNNQYTDLWEKYRPVIIKLIKDGGGQYPLYKGEFEQRGNRDRYSFSMTVEDGKVPELGASAVARDLKTVLDGSVSFRKYSAGKTIEIRLTSSFTLEVSIS